YNHGSCPVSNRPDFLMLGYPATGMSENIKITGNMPPAFIVVAGNDGLMPASVDLFQKLKALNVPAELHIYQQGGHGFGVGTTECHCSNWTILFRNWLDANGIIE
ncbi:MAG TPA: alpha/beta hydrolase fold domain-containing protein, partial [Bacteroidales bacterium]|nr:alpha/beta hydrolase fold domain-containing protein [Bacteroidales bacterium]